MYIVLTSKYDKVLKSIDEKDKKVLEQLNIEKESSVRPSEKYFDDVANIELQDNITNPHEMETSKFIDPETLYNQPEQTFGEPEFSKEEVEIIPNIDISSENPLKNDCSKTGEHEKFIQMIEPSLKRKKIAKPILKQNPQIERIKASDKIQHNIKNPEMKVAPLRNIPRNFVCNVCSKRFKSTYHLKRHVNGVHKNFSELSNKTKPENITQPEEFVSTQPQVFPQQISSNFQNWHDNDISDKPSVKRKVLKTDLKYRRPTKTRKNQNEEFDEWNMS